MWYWLIKIKDLLIKNDNLAIIKSKQNALVRANRNVWNDPKLAQEDSYGKENKDLM